MDVHKPKPVHNAREFLGEVAIIVLGVLIALVLEQVVQRWEWAHKVDAAEQEMTRELFWDDAPEMIQRASVQPCINAQLDAIRAAVEADRPRAEIVDLADRLYLPFVTFDSIAHQDATASDVATHMSKDRADVWTQAYGMIPLVDATNAMESADAARIKALKRTGGPLSVAEQMALLEGVERVRADGVRMQSGIAWSMSVLPKLHGTLDKGRLDGFMKSARLHYGECARDLPPDWPDTLLTPWTRTSAPGLAVAHAVDPVRESHEADRSTLAAAANPAP